ncbi:hypothetical protein ACFQ2B_33565 [Streptomyces stramineus]
MVEQFEAATTDERTVKDLDESNLSGMRKMLTAEVARFRAVEESLLAGSGARTAIATAARSSTWPGTGRRTRYRRRSSTWCSRTRRSRGPDPAEPAAQGVVHKFGLKNARQYGSSRPDDDVQLGLLVEAIGLADVLIAAFPDDREALESKREKLREYLARFAQ